MGDITFLCDVETILCHFPIVTNLSECHPKFPEVYHRFYFLQMKKEKIDLSQNNPLTFIIIFFVIKKEEEEEEEERFILAIIK